MSSIPLNYVPGFMYNGFTLSIPLNPFGLGSGLGGSGSNTSLEIAYPWVLVAGAAVLACLLWVRPKLLKRSKPPAVVFSNVSVLKHVQANVHTPRRSRWLTLLRALSLACCVLALSGPRLGKGTQEIKASGIDILLGVDISSSMLALDFAQKGNIQTRLDVAKEVVQEFIEKRPHDRLGLVAFSGDPYLVSPLTLNHNWVLRNLERIYVGLVEDGTAIGSAIAMGTNRLRGVPAKSRIMVLLTDGVNNAGAVEPLTAAEAAANFGIKIYTIAAGGDEPVRIPFVDDKGQLMTDVRGRVLFRNGYIEPADTLALRNIAQTTGGTFFRATDRKQLREIYRQIDALEKTEVQLRTFNEYTPLFIYPVLLALLLFIGEIALRVTVLRKLPE